MSADMFIGIWGGLSLIFAFFWGEILRRSRWINRRAIAKVCEQNDLRQKIYESIIQKRLLQITLKITRFILDKF